MVFIRPAKNTITSRYIEGEMNNYCTVFGGLRGVLKTMYKFIQRNHRQCILHDKAESDSAD